MPETQMYMSYSQGKLTGTQQVLFIWMPVGNCVTLALFYALFPCISQQGPGSGGFLPQRPYNDIPETFDDSMSFQVIKAGVIHYCVHVYVAYQVTDKTRSPCAGLTGSL